MLHLVSDTQLIIMAQTLDFSSRVGSVADRSVTSTYRLRDQNMEDGGVAGKAYGF